MIKIGIIGLGNVVINVHLPILLARDDVKISWIFDTDTSKKNLFKKKKIPFFSNLLDAINFKECDIALIAIPYYSRAENFEIIKNKVSGIYFEKPFALNLKDHEYFLYNFQNYTITAGYQRRCMGIVREIRNIIKHNLFGTLEQVQIHFGDIHYKFDSFRSDITKSGGGIFFEAGSHWIDTVIYTTLAKNIKNFFCEKKIENYLDVESIGSFNIINNDNKEFECKFNISSLKNLDNKITYKFKNCFIDLHLFDDDSSLEIKTKNNSKFYITGFEYKNFPSTSLEIGNYFWETFLKSINMKKELDISASNSILTSKIIELFYDK